MRAAFVLALLVSLAAPPGGWQAGVNASPPPDARDGLSAPPGVVCQLVRDCGKAEKTFSGGWSAALSRAFSLPRPLDSDHPSAHAPQRRAIAIDSPPLAPRPPPSSLRRH
ncbi:MAG TPA: hypothetical protein VFV51_13625 [Vicinamibacterales bacterium]|nr:hypothetical protein [Vicinamibacterales bacterium]